MAEFKFFVWEILDVKIFRSPKLSPNRQNQTSTEGKTRHFSPRVFMKFGSENKEFLIFMPNITQLFWIRIFFLSNKDEAGYFVSSETENYANQAAGDKKKPN